MKRISIKENLEKFDIKYYESEDIYHDSCNIIDYAKDYAYNSVNVALIERNWLLGYRINVEELKGEIEKQKEIIYLQNKKDN